MGFVHEPKDIGGILLEETFTDYGPTFSVIVD